MSTAAASAKMQELSHIQIYLLRMIFLVHDKNWRGLLQAYIHPVGQEERPSEWSIPGPNAARDLAFTFVVGLLEPHARTESSYWLECTLKYDGRRWRADSAKMVFAGAQDEHFRFRHESDNQPITLV